MRLSLSLLLAVLLATPLANAGGVDASVDYLEADGYCHSTSDFHQHNGSYTDGNYTSGYYHESWSQHEGCQEDFTTAGASATVDDEEAAGVRLGGHDSSNWSDRQAYDSWYFNDGYNGQRSTYSSTWSSSWGYSERTSRGVEAHVLGEEADVTNDCWRSSSGAYSDSSSWSDSEYGSQGGYDHESTYASNDGCWQGASTDVAGRDAQAGRDSGCEDDQSRSSSSSGSQQTFGNKTYWSTTERESESYDSTCRDLVTAGSGDATVAAGHRSACSSSGEAYEEEYGDESDNATHSYAYDSSQSHCKSGIVVEGPDGIELFLGGEDEQWNDCWDESCESSEWRQRYAQLSWSHSPLGSDPYRVHVPLLA